MVLGRICRQYRNNRQEQEERRKGQDHLSKAHQDIVHHTAVIAGHGAHDGADGHGGEGGHKAHAQ